MSRTFSSWGADCSPRQIVDQDDAATKGKWQEHLKGREIKIQRRRKQKTAQLGIRYDRAAPPDQVDQVAVLDAGRLGLSGRTGCIEYISKVAGTRGGWLGPSIIFCACFGDKQQVCAALCKDGCELGLVRISGAAASWTMKRIRSVG